MQILHFISKLAGPERLGAWADSTSSSGGGGATCPPTTALSPDLSDGPYLILPNFYIHLHSTFVNLDHIVRNKCADVHCWLFLGYYV